MAERLDDRRLEPGARGERGGDLAVHGQAVASQLAEPARDEPGALRRRPPRADAAHEASDHLAPRAHQRRRHRGVEGQVVAARRRRRLARVGGAAEEAQERELVDGAYLVRRAPHRLRERDGERAGPERVAERLSRAQIRGQRDRGEQLGEAQRAGGRARRRAHRAGASVSAMRARTSFVTSGAGSGFAAANRIVPLAVS